MLFPDYRPCRMRQSEALRRMIRETVLTSDDLILPPGLLSAALDETAGLAACRDRKGLPS